MEENRDLEAKIKEQLSEIAGLKETIAVLQRLAPANVAVVHHRLVAPYILLPLMLLIGAHYFLVDTFDQTPLVFMRAVSIALPAVFGYRLEIRWRPPWLLLLTAALWVAILSVYGMNALVHMNHPQQSIIAQDWAHWREDINYMASIALGYLFGALLAATLKPRHSKLGVVHQGNLIERLATIAALNSGRDDKSVDQRIDRYYKIIGLTVSTSSAVGSIYTGFNYILS